MPVARADGVDKGHSPCLVSFFSVDEPGQNPVETLLIEQLRKASPDYPHPLTRLTRLDSVADFDSLDAMEFILFLEDQCSFTVSEAAMAALKKPGVTIADFASWLT